jgi:hypothetical protein
MFQLNLQVVPMVIFFVGTSCIVTANFIFYAILGEVNGRRNRNEQISMLFVNIKSFEVVRLHTELYPDSQKRTAMYVIAAVGFALMFGAFVSSLHLGSTR